MTKEEPNARKMVNSGFAARVPRQRPGTGDGNQIAAQALSFLAEDPEQLGRFLSITGLTPQSLRAAAGEPGFVRGVLAYVLADEDLLVGLAGHLGHDPAALASAMQAAAGPHDSGE